MRNLPRLVIVIMLATLAFSGCQETKNLLDITFQADYESEMNIVVSPSTTKAGINGTFSSFVTIDPFSDSTYQTYANTIQSVEIIEASATIDSVSINAVMLNATLTISAEGLPSAEWLYLNEPIIVGNTIIFGNENGQLDKLSAILNDRKVLTLTFSGETDEDDVVYTMQFYILAQIVANPI